ncbi:MAG: aldo/keto reductase [Gemmatimonadaceae bacterium]
MIGLGCMRLSTAPARDEARGISVIHAALAAGVTLLDTADVYGHDEHDIGHNERLIAAALRAWSGDRARIEVATKGGLTRSKGAWVNDGRAKHLRVACEASLRALDVSAIDLYQLHAVDPRTPIETSVRALAGLKNEGMVRRVGLCNVTVGQIEAARRLTDVASVQVSLSMLDDESLRNGVAEYCRDHGIRLMAYRPLGGERRTRLARDPVLKQIAARHGATPEEIALGWLLSFCATARPTGEFQVVPIPGATREATARSIGTVSRIVLTDTERQELDDRFSGRLLRVPRAARRPPGTADGEVVLVMGMPGAGKSSVARELERRSYERLNRDARGGSLSDLVSALDAGLAQGRRRWVLDNTHPSRASRNDVIECAWRHGVPARCIWLTTSVTDAQVNAITRLIEVHGRLPTTQDLRDRGKDDPRYFGPDAQFRYERVMEAPVPEEGFTAVEVRAFTRRRVPDARARALSLEFDDVLVTNAGGSGPVLQADDLAIVPHRREVLARYRDADWRLFAHAWRPQIAADTVTVASVEQCFDRARDLLGLEIELAYCPHAGGPPVCWCRKPLPGLVLAFALQHRIDLERSKSVGRSPADRTLAEKLAMTYHEAEAFFATDA